MTRLRWTFVATALSAGTACADATGPIDPGTAATLSIAAASRPGQPPQKIGPFRPNPNPPLPYPDDGAPFPCPNPYEYDPNWYCISGGLP